MAGKANKRFTYSIRRIRDAGYTTRGVDVVQESELFLCLSCICSFKKPEKASIPSINISQQMDLQSEFAAALRNKRPDDH